MAREIVLHLRTEQHAQGARSDEPEKHPTPDRRTVIGHGLRIWRRGAREMRALARRSSLRDLANLLNSLRRLVRVDALDLQQLVARRVGDRGRVRIGRGESRLDPFGHDALGFVDERRYHLRFGHHAYDLTLDEQVTLTASGGD